MTDLVRMTRADGAIADVRPDWVDDWAGRGWLVGGVSDALVLTREGIAEMDKADVLDLLEAHGWDGDKRLGVGRLREALIAIMFVDA